LPGPRTVRAAEVAALVVIIWLLPPRLTE
jgi:hypothetical protein